MSAKSAAVVKLSGGGFQGVMAAWLGGRTWQYQQ